MQPFISTAFEGNGGRRSNLSSNLTAPHYFTVERPATVEWTATVDRPFFGTKTRYSADLNDRIHCLVSIT